MNKTEYYPSPCHQYIHNIVIARFDFMNKTPKLQLL